MRQTLFYIPHEIAGLPVFGLGWLAIVWLIFGIGLFVWLWRRHGWNSETRSYLPLLGMLAAAIVFLMPRLEASWQGEIQGLPVRGYGVMLLAGVLAGVFLAMHRARRIGVDPEIIVSLAFWIFIAGIAGARTFFVIQYWDDYRKDTFRETFMALLNVAQGGLVVYGSLVAVLIAFVLFARFKKLPALALGDLIAPSMMLGLALGRIGCLFNGCCYGGLCDYSWAIAFPHQSPPYKHQQQQGLLQGIRLDRDELGGPVVAEVLPNSPAADSGIQQGDLIQTINGVPVTSLESAEQMLRATRANLWLTLESGKTVGWPLPPADLPAPMYFGIKLAGDSQDRPVVEKIDTRGFAADTEIQIGDRIVAINGEKVASPAEAQAILQKTRPNLWVRRSDDSVVGWSLPLRSLPVHPTQIYSAINAGLICLVLLAFSPYKRHDGQVIALLLLLYSITRFLLEIIRVDETAIFNTSLTISQNVSLVMLTFAIFLGIYVSRRPRGKHWPAQALLASKTPRN